MGYIESNLSAGERLVFNTKLHGAIFIGPVSWFTLGLLVGSAVLVAVATFLGLSALINWTTTEIGVTNRRLMGKTGFMQRKSIDMMLIQIEGIGVYQGLLGRIIGYGTIVVGGTDGTRQRFSGIARPFDLVRRVNQRGS